MGVELGKVLAKNILAQLNKPEDVKGHDSSVRTTCCPANRWCHLIELITDYRPYPLLSETKERVGKFVFTPSNLKGKMRNFCNQKAINCHRPTVSSNILVQISKASVIELGRKMIPISCLSLQWTSRKSGCPVPNAIRWGETWNASLVSRTIHYSHFMWLEGLTELTRQLFVGRWLKVDCIFPSLRTEMFLGWRPLTLLRCNVGKWE